MVDEEEWRRLLRNQQDQATITTRLQVELAGHLKDSALATQQFYEFVMQPEHGSVVKIRRLQDGLEALARNVSVNGAEASKVAGLDRRVKAVEDVMAAEAAARADKRQWTWRQVVVPFLAVVAALVIEKVIDWAMQR